MARFVGSSVARTLGITAAASGFTKAEIFTTPGSTTWSVPDSASNLKVYVVGAGAEYNMMTHCYSATNCNSGTTSLGCNYCMTFYGHVPGAGGGYSEKLITAPAGTANITVGARGASVGDTPTDSCFELGAVNVVAYSARHVDATWACTGNAVARDNTNFLPTSIGFQIPTCGYINCTTGYWTIPGCASGGDINRVGGCSTIIPEFICDSNIRPNTYQCPTNIACGLACTVGTIFFPGTASQRQCLTTAGSKCGPLSSSTVSSTGPGVCPPSSSLCCCKCFSYDYYYGGEARWCMCACAFGDTGGTTVTGTLAITYDPSFRKYSNVPIGIGASAGTSESNGTNGKAEVFTVTPIYDAPGTTGASGSSFWCVSSRSLRDSTFGSYCYCCCFTLCPGSTGIYGCACYMTPSVGTCCCWLLPKGCNCDPYTSLCLCFPSIGGGSPWQPAPYYDITYMQTETALSELTGETFYLNDLTDSNGAGWGAIKYGSGAGSSAATYGGGGNRCYSAADGIVVVLY